jgi:hypothetical protein
MYFAQQNLQDIYDVQNAVTYAKRGYGAYQFTVWFRLLSWLRLEMGLEEVVNVLGLESVRFYG